MNIAQDRILQGRFFLKEAEKVSLLDRDAFRYCIEAAIVAARSVTNLLQKQYHSIDGFPSWYAAKQDQLRGDPLSRFLVEKRNFVLKEGVANVKKHIQVTIHDDVYFTETIRVRIVRGSFMGRIRHLPQDLIRPLKEKRADWKQQRQRRRREQAKSDTKTVEGYFFDEQEWVHTPAVDLLKSHIDTLESIVNEAAQLFGEPEVDTNGG